MAKHPALPTPEISAIGEVDDWEADVVKALLEVPRGGRCTFYLDSCGGSVFGALAVLTLMRQRQIEATAVVLGECSSSALLVLAGCKRRLVTPFSTLLFHRMHWRSEKRVTAVEALHWAKHFDDTERDVDRLQARLFGVSEELLRKWTEQSRFVSGREFAEAGLGELFEI